MHYIRKLRNLCGADKLIVNCAAAWIENENGILLERRSDDGNWGLIGGVMELGEGIHECIAREVREETGQVCEISHLIGIYSKYHHEYPNGDQVQPIVHFFAVDIDSSSKLEPSDESFELKYFPRDALPKLGMIQHQDMLADALRKARSIVR